MVVVVIGNSAVVVGWDTFEIGFPDKAAWERNFGFVKLQYFYNRIPDVTTGCWCYRNHHNLVEERSWHVLLPDFALGRLVLVY